MTQPATTSAEAPPPNDRPWRRGILRLALVVAVIAAPGVDARAYTIGSVLTFGCHEKLTTDALRAVRKELPTAAPLPTSDDERAFVDDLQFTPDDDMRDLGGATLLASVRDNDLKGRGSGDLSSLAEIHGNPADQREHCLRTTDQKEPTGTMEAVLSCRVFIRTRAAEAIDALDDAGRPDLGNRTSLQVQLSLRGGVLATLPTYYVRIGQAMHALQDSFTHSYRTPDGLRITASLNWLAVVDGTLDEAVDGPPHVSALDQCDDADALRKQRRLLATNASTELLRATLDPEATRDEKLARVDAVLDEYLTYQPGCTAANHWCAAPETRYPTPASCACSMRRDESDLGALGAVGAVGILSWLRRSKRRAPIQRLLARSGASLAVLTIAASAHAQAPSAPSSSADPPLAPAPTSPPASSAPPPSAAPAPLPAPPTSTTTTVVPGPTLDKPAAIMTTVTSPEVTTTTVVSPTKPNEHAPPPPVVVPVKEPGPTDPNALAFGGYLGVSGAIDKAALAYTLGARLRLTKHWTVGIDVEHNPWIALNGTPIRAGAFNFYGTGILRFPLAYEMFNLRTTLNLGGSALLTPLYGAPAGSVGLYAGASFLGLEWKASRYFFLILNPINLAVPIPHLTGVPLLYPQYRITLGAEVYSG